MMWSLEVAARTLWQEARGEPLEGQQAVSHVLWNRMHSGRWGRTLAEVCLAPFQFSGWNAHDPNRMAAARLADDDPLLSALRGVLADAEHAPDPTCGATHYFADSIPAPAWAANATSCGKFGHQHFYKHVR